MGLFVPCLLTVAMAAMADSQKADVMRHTEAALRLPFDAHDEFWRELDAARRIVDSLPVSANIYKERWYVLASTALLARTDPLNASRVIDAGRRHFKNNATLKMLEGVVEEMRGHIMNSNLHDVRTITAMTPTPARLRLNYAQACYRDALKLDPHLAEARLRLGRVLYLRNEPRPAQAELETVAATATEPRLAYLAHLFLGAVAQQQNDRDSARRHYEQAIAIAPEHQTAYIALSFLEDMSGDAARAQRVVAERPMPASRDNDDPWWEYQNGGVDMAAYEWLRAESIP